MSHEEESNVESLVTTICRPITNLLFSRSDASTHSDAPLDSCPVDHNVTASGGSYISNSTRLAVAGRVLRTLSEVLGTLSDLCSGTGVHQPNKQMSNTASPDDGVVLNIHGYLTDRAEYCLPQNTPERGKDYLVRDPKFSYKCVITGARTKEEKEYAKELEHGFNSRLSFEWKRRRRAIPADDDTLYERYHHARAWELLYDRTRNNLEEWKLSVDDTINSINKDLQGKKFSLRNVTQKVLEANGDDTDIDTFYNGKPPLEFEDWVPQLRKKFSTDRLTEIVRGPGSCGWPTKVRTYCSKANALLEYNQ